MALNYRQATVLSFSDWLGELKTEFETIGMTINASDTSNVTIASQGLHITHPGNGASWCFEVKYPANTPRYVEFNRALCLGYNAADPFDISDQPNYYYEGNTTVRFYDEDFLSGLTLHIFSSAVTNTVILYMEYPDGRSTLFIQTDLNTTLNDSGIYTVSSMNRNYQSGTTSGTVIFAGDYTQMYAVFDGGNDGTVSTSYGRGNDGYYNASNNKYPDDAWLFQRPTIPTENALTCKLLPGGLRLLEPLPIRAAKKDQTCALLGYVPDMYATNIKDAATGQTYTINGKKYIFVRVGTWPSDQVIYTQHYGLAIEIV